MGYLFEPLLQTAMNSNVLLQKVSETEVTVLFSLHLKGKTLNSQFQIAFIYLFTHKSCSHYVCVFQILPPRTILQGQGHGTQWIALIL